MTEEKQPFVSGQDRPKVGLDPDMPISELRVRDLQAIVGGGRMSLKSIVADAGVFKRYYKDWFKEYIKEWSDRKRIKDIVDEFEYEIPEFELPGPGPGPGPLMDQLVATMTRLSEQVDNLAKEVAELKQRG
jgi:hypothetical protein